MSIYKKKNWIQTMQVNYVHKILIINKIFLAAKSQEIWSC